VRRVLYKKKCADLMRVLHRVENGTLQTAKAVSSLLLNMWSQLLAVDTREREETELEQACAAMDASLDGELRSLLDTLEKAIDKQPEKRATGQLGEASLPEECRSTTDSGESKESPA
jgi:hypothetical protein